MNVKILPNRPRNEQRKILIDILQSTQLRFYLKNVIEFHVFGIWNFE